MNEAFRLSIQQTQACNQDFSQATAQLLINLDGELNVQCFMDAVQNLLQDNEIFSTGFSRVPGVDMPLQVVFDFAMQWLPLVDLSHADDAQEQLSGLAQHSCMASDWQLEYAGPKAQLVNLGGQNHIAILTFHALHIDAGSMVLLLNELASQYRGLIENQPVEREEDDILQYIDASESNYELLGSDESLEGKRFWQQLDFLRHASQRLPIEFAKPGGDAQLLHTDWSTIDGQLLDGLQHFASGQGVDVSDVMFAAWQALLYRMNPLSEVLVSRRFDGRTDDELETTMGLLAKFLPCTMAFDDETSLSALVRNNQPMLDDLDSWQECFDWQNIEGATDLIEPRQFLYAFEMDHTAKLSVGDLSMTIKDRQVHIDRFHLCLSGEQQADSAQIRFRFSWDGRYLSRLIIDMLAGQLTTLLSGALAQPDQPFALLPLLPPSQIESITETFNALPSAAPSAATVVQMITKQASDNSAAIAVEHLGQSLTYGEMEQLANDYAWRLIDNGVVPGQFVGVCVERSVAAVVAILAILKAGAVYVPLDPSYPKHRLDHIIGHCATQVILTCAEFASRFDDKCCILLDADTSEASASKAPDVTVQGDDAAYLIYTSGSTGVPKGILVSHKALAEHCASVVMHFKLQHNDRVLLFAPFNFDPSLEQCLPTLCVGATVVVREETLWSVNQVAEKIAELKLTVVNFPTPFWHLLVQAWENEPPLQQCQTLRLVISGGDKMLPDMASRWAAIGLRGVRLLNAYGPTETTVTASTAEHFELAFKHYNQLPIGKPLPNRRMYILDQRLQPVPIGTVGELYIGGSSVASGYLHDEALTRERFIADPYSTDGSRMYKTGDRAYYAVDGDIYFVGRSDTQVKIRGFRIEPLEVEQQLSTERLVREAAVLVRDLNDADDKQLIACYVSVDDNVHDDELALRLKARLPEYMCPAVYLCFDQFPLMPNGKLDRNSLAELTQSRLMVFKQVVKAQTETEQQLADLWAELLGLQAVSRDDNFLNLGGHSLVAMRLISRVEQTFSMDLTLRDIFSTGTLDAMAAHIDEHRNDNRQLATFNLVNNPITALPYTDEGVLLSYSQERIWFLSQMGQSRQYHMPDIISLEAKLDADLLQQSFTALVQRHQGLRTVFRQKNQLLRQYVEPQLAVQLEQAKLPSKAGLAPFFANWAGRPFNLTESSLFRLILIDTVDQHYLAVCLHHIISDALSNNILLADLGAIYSALAEGKTDPLTPLKLQYSDYAVWQRNLLSTDRLQLESSYWADKLSDYQDLDINTGRSRPLTFSGQGGRLTKSLTAQLATQLKQLCQQQGVTLFTSLLASVFVLLRGYSQSKDFCMGVPFSDRPGPSLDNVVGIFLNSLVIRLGSDIEQMSVGQMLAHTQQTLLDAQSHHVLPFEKLVEHLQPARDLSRNPVFQVMVNHIQPLKTVPFGQTQGCLLSPNIDTARFDLNFDFEEFPNGRIDIVFEYSTDLFTPAFVDDLLENLCWVMEQLSTISAPIADVSVVCPRQTQVQLEQWGQGGNIGELNPLLQHDVLDRIASWATVDPDAIAVQCDTEQLSYQQLLHRSARLAGYLKAIGVKDGDRVGICMQRSSNMVMALLAIMQAGATYVPLDANYPLKRLAYIAEDAGLVLIISETALQSLMLPFFNQGNRAVYLDQLLAEIMAESADSPSIEGRVRSAEHEAYLIYTSGSTGKPKGVVLSLVAMTRMLDAMTDISQFSKHSSLLAISTINFDVSVLELFLPLINGGRVYVASNDTGKNSEKLVSEIERIKPDFLQATPVTWTMLQNMGWKNPSDVSLLSCGEAMSPSLYHYLKAHSSLALNLYGPTEATVQATAKVLQTPSPLSIGRPIAGYSVYVLDENLRPLPAGVAGELFIGGCALANGYWNKPEATAKAFITHPFNPNERLYRSGDLVVWQDSGDDNAELGFIRRVDHQIKLRGYRIEAGEIETILCQHESIKTAVVVVIETDTVAQLMACYTLQSNAAAPEVGELRQHLSQQLPAHMIPDSFNAQDKLPLTPNLKIDRNALIAQLQSQPVVTTAALETSELSELQGRLAELWQAQLKVDKLHLEHDFFALGGHSLLLVLLQNQIQEAFGCKLPLDQLFKHKTLSAMSQLLENAQSNTQSVSLIDPEQTPQFAPLSFIQQGLWLDEQLSGGSNKYNMVFSVDINGRVDGKSILAALVTIEQRHEVLRSHLIYQNGQAQQVVSAPMGERFYLDDLSTYTEAQQQSVLAERQEQEYQRVMDLENDPLWYVHLLQMSAEHMVLVFNFHHICTDGWSMGVLLGEIQTLIHAKMNNLSAALPELPVQYRDYAYWQRQEFESGAFGSQMDFWQQRLAGAPALTPLPLDFPRSEMPEHDGAVLNFTFEAELAQQIRQFASDHDITPYMLLLTGFNLLLYVETGEDDICVGTDVANRHQQVLKPLIGFFVNQLVLRTQLNSDESLLQLIQHVKDHSLQAFSNQDVLLEQLLSQLNVTREKSHSPLFQAKFIMEHPAEPSAASDGFSIVINEMQKQPARVDLSLRVLDYGDRLLGDWVYNTQLFRASTAERLKHRYVEVISALIAQPEQVLGDLRNTLDAAQKQRKSEKKSALLKNKATKFKKRSPRECAD